MCSGETHMDISSIMESYFIALTALGEKSRTARYRVVATTGPAVCANGGEATISKAENNL